MNYKYIEICRYICFAVFFSLTIDTGIFAQNSNFSEQEKDLKTLFDTLFTNNGVKYYLPDDVKDKINNQIIEIFDDILYQPGAFDYNFDSLNKVGKIVSFDKKLKILSWNIQYSNGGYKYFAYMLYKYNKKKTHTVYKLIDKTELNNTILHQVLFDTNWYGALYYNIIDVKSNGRNYYTLLGWDGNDYYSTKKVIDVVYFKKRGGLFIGKEIFVSDTLTTSRVIFEYSEKSVMSLNYNEDLGMIVFDYLVPPSSIYVGKYQFYGPDGTYEAFAFERGKWYRYSNIDISLLKNKNYRAGKKKKHIQAKRIYSNE
ncbi:MAG: hypothetical protein Kow0068_22510 [Marinilabiliales bacterium]